MDYLRLVVIARMDIYERALSSLGERRWDSDSYRLACCARLNGSNPIQLC